MTFYRATTERIKLKNNIQIITDIICSILILITWLVVNYIFQNSVSEYMNLEALLIPSIWVAFFLYLKSKNHFYIAVNSYLIFLVYLMGDLLNFGLTSKGTQVSYMLWPICVSFFTITIYQNSLLKPYGLAAIFGISATIGLYSIPLFYIIYAFNFGTYVTSDIFYAVMQTNTVEALEYAADYISPLGIFPVVTLFAGTLYLFLKNQKRDFTRIENSVVVFIVLILSTLSFQVKKDFRLVTFMIESIEEYRNELRVFAELQAAQKNNNHNFEASKVAGGETYIVVIGESLNKNHMSLYGYVRDTTPLLDKKYADKQILKFDNAYSTHTHTMEVLSQALTEANLQNSKNYYDSLSIINILNKANIDTYWITNQALYGEWDNLVSVIGQSAGNLISLNDSIGRRIDTQVHDEIVVEEVNKVLGQQAEKDRVIFVHLMGSHGSYCSRYPSEYQSFSEPLEISEYGKMATSFQYLSKLNCYDNSILYNDFVIDSLINLLRDREETSALIYFADHGEDVLRNLGHNSARFTYNMVNIPMIMWFSDKYQAANLAKINLLKSRQDSLFSNDFIFDSLIGILNISTDHYFRTGDISSRLFTFSEKSASTLHGKVPYFAPENLDANRKKNVNSVKEMNQQARILPHRANTLGKVKKLWSEGYRSFEIDVVFQNGVFMVGHDYGVLNGISLDEFLSEIKIEEVEKIWLDVKNLSSSNYEILSEKLTLIDEKYSLKNKTIFESSTIGKFFTVFASDDWHTSYYLPTEKILELMRNENTANSILFARKLGEQISRQNVKAISFDHRLYPFVKVHIEPFIPRNIDYHTWDLTLKLHSTNFIRSIQQNNYFNDERIKTILVPTITPYDL